ncbi:TPA: hypothetical protein ACX3MJ_005876 [Raoultella ornithinolytica]
MLAESSDERLVDLVKRRLLHAYLPVETPATDDALVAMGDAVLLEQLEDSRKAIVSQSNIIGLKEKRIAELEPIRSAAEKLVRCKGRYHSEQNYRALAALFGVTAPDLPPLDSESRTVKLPVGYTASSGHPFNEAERTVMIPGGGDWLNRFDVEHVLTAAGIKVEAE